MNAQAALAKPIRVVIVDDHSFVRMGVIECLELERDIEVVAQAGNGADAIDACRRALPDIMLVDLVLPDMTGVDVLRTVARDFPSTKTIVLSTYDGEDDVYSAFQAGASGYVLKSMDQEALVQAIRAVHGGAEYVPPGVGERLIKRMRRGELSTRELEVLGCIVNGLSNKEIGSALEITEGTVKLHVHNLLKKLGVADRTQATSMALQRGLIRSK